MTSFSESSCDGTLCEKLKETKGLLVGLRQEGDWAATFQRAAEKHTSPAKAPHSIAARIQAAGLPTCRPASPVCHRVPTHGDGATPVDPQHPAGHPAEIC